ncbi:MAG: ABC transporter substrate-binding protein [Bacilli bacterium]
MKKLLCVSLALLMGLSLTGCGSSSKDDGDGVKLTFWGHQNEPWNDSYKKIAKEFTKENPDIKINFEFFPYDQFESKVQTALMSNEGGADIYELWGGWAIDFASNGSLAAMPKDLTKTIREDAYPSTIGALEYKDNLYGMPMEFNIESGAMLVNNNVLNKKQLTLPTTWAELRQIARDATEKDGDTITTKGFDFVNWDSVPYTFLSMILSKGGNYTNEDGTFNVQTPEAKAALQELYDMVAVDKVTTMEGLNGGAAMEGYQQLFAGTTAIVPRGPWTISEGVSSFELEFGKDFDYVSMPWYGDKPAFAAETGWSMAVNNNSKQKKAAFKFLKYFFKDEVIMKHNIDCAQIPAKKSVAQNPELLEKMPYAKPLVPILDKAQFIGYFNTDQFKEQVNGAFVDLVEGKTTSVDEALKNMETKLNKILKK